MSLTTHDLQTALHVSSITTDSVLTRQDIIPLIDLTILDKQATPADIANLAAKATKYQVAALCIYPEHYAYVPLDCPIKRATVVNFPTGTQAQEHVLKTIEKAADQQHVDEIDYVFPYQAYLAGDERAALAACHEVYERCKHHDLTCKVILETGALPSIDTIYRLSVDVIKSGCDFLKTSTGKIATGATHEAALAILTAIMDTNPNCGIKLSGGIRTVDQALTYMRLAEYMLKKPITSTWFRLGASSLLDDILNAHNQ